MGRGHILDELDGVVCVAGEAVVVISIHGNTLATCHESRYDMKAVIIIPFLNSRQLTANSETLELQSLSWYTAGLEKVIFLIFSNQTLYGIMG